MLIGGFPYESTEGDPLIYYITTSSTYIGLFEGFSTIIRQLKDNAVKGGFSKDHKRILKHLSNEE